MPRVAPDTRQHYYPGAQWAWYFDRSIFGAIDDDANTGRAGVPQQTTVDVSNQVEHFFVGAETHNARQASPSQGCGAVMVHASTLLAPSQELTARA
jgi:hypothetical protein